MLSRLPSAQETPQRGPVLALGRLHWHQVFAEHLFWVGEQACHVQVGLVGFPSLVGPTIDVHFRRVIGCLVVREQQLLRLRPLELFAFAVDLDLAGLLLHFLHHPGGDVRVLGPAQLLSSFFSLVPAYRLVHRYAFY